MINPFLYMVSQKMLRTEVRESGLKRLLELRDLYLVTRDPEVKKEIIDLVNELMKMDLNEVKNHFDRYLVKILTEVCYSDMYGHT